MRAALGRLGLSWGRPATPATRVKTGSRQATLGAVSGEGGGVALASRALSPIFGTQARSTDRDAACTPAPQAGAGSVSPSRCFESSQLGPSPGALRCRGSAPPFPSLAAGSRGSETEPGPGTRTGGSAGLKPPRCGVKAVRTRGRRPTGARSRAGSRRQAERGPAASPAGCSCWLPRGFSWPG